MSTTRLRIAVMGCIAPSLIAMLALNREEEPPRSGPVWGRVSYNGRPLDRGAILFAPPDTLSGEWVLGPIGKDGMYAISPEWRRHRPGKACFRIGIVPFPYTFRAQDMMPPSTQEPGQCTDLASPAVETTDDPQQFLDPLPIPARFSDIWTSGLMVTLDQDSARVDINLKD